MGITIKINDVDRTEYVDARSLSITDELTSKVNTASFKFICNDPAIAPVSGQTVLIEKGTTKLFSGRILNDNEDFLPPSLLKYDIECVDHTRDLDKKLISESYVDQKAGDIIKDIIDKIVRVGIPTGHNDPDNQWDDEIYAYDNDVATYAQNLVTEASWGNFLELNIDPMICDRVRFFAGGVGAYITEIDIDVYYDETWHHVYQGAFTSQVWEEKSLGGDYLITKARVRFYCKPNPWPRKAYLYEFNFGASHDFTTNNVADGPVISKIAFNYVQVSDAITRIAEMCGYEWYVDYDKDIHFFFKTDFPAPFQLDDDQANYKDLMISKDISQIRNRIYIKSSAIKDTFGEVFIGDGVTTSWVCKYRAEIMLPTGIDIDTPRWAGNAVEFSHNDVYLAVGLDWVLGMPQCPDLIIYKRSGDTFTKLPYPATEPTGNVYGVAWSDNDVYLAAGHESSPRITIYKRDEDIFIKLDNPADLPTGNGNGLDFGYNDTYLAIAHYTSPYITIYKRSGDTFTKLTNPANLPTGTGYDAAFSPDGVYLAVVHATTPFITIYKRSGDTFTKLANPADLPVGNALDVAFSPDGIYLAVGHTTTPFITIYKRDGDTFTKLADPIDLPTGYVTGVAFAPNSTHLATSHKNSPYVTLYKRGGDTFVKVDDPSPLPTGDGLSTAVSYDNRYIALGHYTSPRLTIYKHFVPLIKVNGIYKTIGWYGIDNPLYYDFMLNANTKVLSLGTASTPADGVELFVIYTYLGAPICLRRDNKDSITDRIEKEGGDGIIEFCLVDNNIDSPDWANEAAKADLLQNADPIIKATFKTNRSDLKSGQIITLTSTKRGITKDFLVHKIELIRVDVVWGEGPIIPLKPSPIAEIELLPSETAKIPIKPKEGVEIIYYLFNVTISTRGVKKLEDVFLYLLSKTGE